jgi:NADH:ubiquinone oxidoreductase subunit B-like Fe-S oxidoreductase
MRDSYFLSVREIFVQDIPRGWSSLNLDFTKALSAIELADVRACDKTDQAERQNSIPNKAERKNRLFVYSGQVINKSMITKGT